MSQSGKCELLGCISLPIQLLHLFPLWNTFPSGQRPSYAEVSLRNQLPIKQASTLARQEIQARQVLIDVKAAPGGPEEDNS